MKVTDLFSTACQNLKWKHNCSWILLLKMASGSIRKVKTLTQLESLRNTSKDNTCLLSPYFWSKCFKNLSFVQSKTAGMTKQRRYKLVCKVMRKWLYSSRISTDCHVLRNVAWASWLPLQNRYPGGDPVQRNRCRRRKVWLSFPLEEASCNTLPRAIWYFVTHYRFSCLALVVLSAGFTSQHTVLNVRGNAWAIKTFCCPP